MKMDFKIGFIFLLLIGSLAQNAECQTTVVIPDPGFKARLVRRYSNVLNANQELIIAKAATVTGVMNGNNSNIKSLEGLQYFTSIKEINFPENSITYIPDLSNLKQLEKVTLNDNLMTYLPDFSKNKKLKYLIAHRNKLVYIPDLASNDSLISLNIHSNLLATLPDLSNLKRLEYLHLFNNKLTTVSGLDKLISLASLRLDYNKLTQLPSLKNLIKLSTFYAQGNQLTEIPELPTPNKIKILRMESNSLTVLPNFTGFDSLSDARVNVNKLTFQELKKITVVPNYSNIFNISPQSTVKTGRIVSVKEQDQFYLRTYTDTLVSGVQYDWYKDSTLVTTVTNDRFPFPKANYSDSGRYYAKMRLAELPELVLQTDTFVLTVNPCVDVKTLNSSVVGADCDNSAIIHVNSNPTLSSGTYFSIKGVTSGKEMTSTDGKFTNVNENIYTLKIITSNGCETAFPSTITVPIKNCNDILLTPNSDGNMDTYFFNTSGPIKIYDKRGYLVKSLTGPSEWDGTNEKGKVPVGYYMADINNGESKLGVSVIY